MLRAIIIDDEEIGIDSLKLLLEKYISDVKVVAETTEAEKGIDLIDDYRPEIVFLDINMPFLNGFELLQKLTFKNFNLIFTTAHDEFALKAIKNNALDYLLKPISLDDLKKALNKARDLHNSKQPLPDFSKLIPEINKETLTKLPVTTKNGVDYILIKDVIRLERDNNYTKVFLTNGETYLVKKSLADYESLLCKQEHQFMRVHQSHIVHLKKVVRFLKEDGGTIITTDNFQIPLSKQKKDDFMKWMDIKSF